MFHYIVIHLSGHVTDIMVRVVVHYGICKHLHHITLELNSGTYHSTLNVLLDGGEIQGSENRDIKHIIEDQK